MSLLSPDRIRTLEFLLRSALRMADGDVWECGVYNGGSARVMADVLAESGGVSRLHLFDSFAGLVETSKHDNYHKVGDFSDSLGADHVRQLIPEAHVHQGVLPNILPAGTIAFAHIDVDTYATTKGCLEAAFRSLAPRGIIVVDDYGFATCEGARRACDEFFMETHDAKMEKLDTKQCLFWKTTE